MTIARPKLLVGSLSVAVILVVVVAIVLASAGSDEPDATLTDSQGVVTFPNAGLANEDLRGDPLPRVAVGDRDGNEVQTVSFIGRPLVINFWFSTCAPCAKELPEFAAVHAELGDDVRFIGINLNDSVETMERFAADRGVQYELYLDDTAEFTEAIGAVSFPVTLFVSPQGGIIEQTGVLDADQLRTKIAQLLEEGA